MVTIVGGNKRVEAVKKIRDERITITKGDRVIYLYPVNRVYGKGYGEIITCYDVVFINKAKGIKIDSMSFSYRMGSYSVKGYVSDLYMEIGLSFWYRGEEAVNTTLRAYSEEQITAFYNFVEEAILSELGINK